MCVLYAGIYRVALRLHSESAARRRNMASLTTHLATQDFGPTSPTLSAPVYRHVATANVSNLRPNRTIHLSDSSYSEHDVTPRRRGNTDDATLLLPVSERAKPAIELQELSAHDGSSYTALTFTVDDPDIRFADDVTEDDDDRQVISTSGHDANFRRCQHGGSRDQVSSRDIASASVVSSATAQYRHSAESTQRVDTAGVPARRRFSAHRLLSSRRRQRRSQSPTSGWQRHNSQCSGGGSQVNDVELSTINSSPRRTQPRP